MHGEFLMNTRVLGEYTPLPESAKVPLPFSMTGQDLRAYLWCLSLQLPKENV